MKISYLGNLTSTFLLLTSFFCVQSAPARPLNERSTEFAWVILDEQQSDSSPRRKITPKSIFISPSFGTQSCSTGYTLDASGRCVKVVKLDTSAHEQFVLEFLSQNFSEDYDDEGEEGGDEALPTPGPFQFNIPLGMDTEKDKISIIVAPTNGNFEDTMKIEDTQNLSKPEKKPSNIDAPFIITNINIKDDLSDSDSKFQTTESKLEAGKTTISPVLTTTSRTTIRETRPDDVPTSTIPTTIDDSTTLTTPSFETTTILDQGQQDTEGQDELLPEAQEQQAIFFKLPEDFNAEITTEAEISQTQPTTTNSNTIRFPDRPTFDEALFQDFLQDMKKQVNRRFVTKTSSSSTSSASASSEDALYTNHRNRDRWLFPRFLEDQRHLRR